MTTTLYKPSPIPITRPRAIPIPSAKIRRPHQARKSLMRGLASVRVNHRNRRFLEGLFEFSRRRAAPTDELEKERCHGNKVKLALS